MTVALALGQILTINGAEYRVVDLNQTGGAVSALFCGAVAHTITAHTVFGPALEPSSPQHRNDRAYLKRKKGRS